MPDVVWHPVAETPPLYRPVFATQSDDGRRVQLAWAGLRVWFDMDNNIIHGVTHWAEPEYPEPPEEGK